MTLGDKGALLMNASFTGHFPAISVTPVDTTGAGDAFNAGLAVALSSGAAIEEATEFAVITGGLAVTKEGVIPSLPGRKEVVEFMKQNHREAPHWLAANARQAARHE